MTQKELSQALRCTPRNVTGLLDALEDSGLVVRRPHPDDRRATLVDLTTRGKRASAAWAKGYAKLANTLFADLYSAELAASSGCLIACARDSVGFRPCVIPQPNRLVMVCEPTQIHMHRFKRFRASRPPAELVRRRGHGEEKLRAANRDGLGPARASRNDRARARRKSMGRAHCRRHSTPSCGEWRSVRRLARHPLAAGYGR